MPNEPWGARLQRLREALGRRTEPSEIARYESCGYWPRTLTFAALARALGISIEVLHYGEEEAARMAQVTPGSSPGGISLSSGSCDQISNLARIGTQGLRLLTAAADSTR